MNITEHFTGASAGRDDRPGDVIKTYWNGVTFNESAFRRECAGITAAAVIRDEMFPRRAPRVLDDAEHDHEVARQEDWGLQR